MIWGTEILQSYRHFNIEKYFGGFLTYCRMPPTTRAIPVRPYSMAKSLFIYSGWMSSKLSMTFDIPETDEMSTFSYLGIICISFEHPLHLITDIQ